MGVVTPMAPMRRDWNWKFLHDKLATAPWIAEAPLEVFRLPERPKITSAPIVRGIRICLFHRQAERDAFVAAYGVHGAKALARLADATGAPAQP